MIASRKIHFCAGHRVMNHESKCATAHGHNYILWVYAKPKDGLDEIGRVIDFSEIKRIAGGWIDEYWDHNFIVFKDDIAMLNAMEEAPKRKPLFIMPTNPTAENMCDYLLNDIFPHLFAGTNIQIVKVKLYETENCFAELTNEKI